MTQFWGKKRRLAILLSGIVLSMTACFEPQKGCQDIAATNFDASADKDCGCCVYPKLRIGVVQRYDTLPYIENRAYPASNGHYFILKSVSFYLSDFQVFQNGVPEMISDTVGLRSFSPVGTDTLRPIFTDDFVLIRRTPIINEVGTFRNDGAFDQLQFRVGLDDNAQLVIPQLAPATHPLHTQGDNLWHGRSAGFVFAQVIVARDTLTGTPTDTLALTKAEMPDMFFSASGPFHHETGYNFDLILIIDHKKLLEGIDWTTGDISAWKARIVANLPNAFSVTQ